MKRVITILLSVLVVISCGNQPKIHYTDTSINTNIYGVELGKVMTSTEIERIFEKNSGDEVYIQHEDNILGKCVRVFPSEFGNFVLGKTSWFWADIFRTENNKVFCVAFSSSYEDMGPAEEQYEKLKALLESKYGRANASNNDNQIGSIWSDKETAIVLYYKKSSSINGTTRWFCCISYYIAEQLENVVGIYNTASDL